MVRIEGAEDCDGQPAFSEAYLDKRGDWRIPCSCCKGSGEHPYGKGPDTLHYPCEICMGAGEFEVRIPAH